VATGRRIATFTDPPYAYAPGIRDVRAVAFSPDGSMLATGDDNGNAYVWNVATGRRIATFTDPNSISVGAVAFSPDGSMLAAGDDNGRTYVWDVATGRLIATLAGGGKAVAFSRTGNMLATAGTGSTTVWKYS